MKKHIGITKYICYEGFSGYPGFVARSNFRVGQQETAPQSLPAHTLNRCAYPAWQEFCPPYQMLPV